MSDMVVIVPSRGRPDNVRRLHQAWRDTGADAELLVCVDVDDPSYGRYREAAEGVLMRMPTRGMGAALNLVAREEAKDGQYRHIGFMGDDHLPRGDWDRQIIKALDELGTGIVYGNDLNQGAALPTSVFMTANIVRTLGYMIPPPIEHLYADNVWLNWGRAINRIRYLPDVVIEHLHPTVGKAPSDEGYERVNSGDQYAKDGDAYRSYMADRFVADVEKLQGLL